MIKVGLGIVCIIVIIYFITRIPAEVMGTGQTLPVSIKDINYYMRKARPLGNFLSRFKSCNESEETDKVYNENLGYICYQQCLPGYKGDGDYCSQPITIN